MSAITNELIRKKFGKKPKYYATMGDYDGKVNVPGYNYLRYARVQGVVQKVWDRVTNGLANVEVEIEYLGNQIVVKGLRGRAVPLADGIAVIGKHAETHLEGAFDPVYIWMSQVLNLRVVAAGEFKIQIHPGRHYGEDGWSAPTYSTRWNLASYQPVSGAVWILIYIQRDGTFGLIEGEVVDTPALLTPGMIPALPFGGWAVAAIRLYAGQTAINGIKDVYDLRWAATPYNAAGGISTAAIASGAITAYSRFLYVYGEGDADDDLATINGGSHGSLITVCAPTHTITLKHGTGNIVSETGADVVLDDAAKVRQLVYDATQSKWLIYGAEISIPPSSEISYTPAVLTDWDGDADPGNVDDALDELAERVDDVENIFVDSLDPTGFINRTSSTLSFVDGTRTFTIAPTATNFSFYSNGILFTKTSTSKVITDTAGMHYIYFDTNGAIQSSTSPWSIASGNVPIACVYWNGTNGILMDERHGIQMDGRTHEYLHETVGSRYASGMAGTFAANGSTITIELGEWYDEDIEHTFTQQTNVRIFYLDSTTWKWTSAQAPYYHTVSSVPQYNNSGALADVGANKYSMSWVYATNHATTPIIVIMGQAQYNTQALAEAAAVPTLSSLPAAEMVLLYKVVWQRNGAVITWKSTVDYRRTNGGPVLNYLATDHGSLAGLTDLDHPASAITVDTTNFDNNLSATDDDLQTALETLDDLVGGGGGDASDITYTPTVLTDWDSDTDPGDVDNALDQLAERVEDLEGSAGGHAAVTLAADADVLLSLSTQEIGLDTQSANTVFAGPSSGAAADPTFRALVNADMPAQPVPAGTSFPGSPATNDLYFRTDRGILYFYDGSRWLSVTLYTQEIGSLNNISATSYTYYPVLEDLYDVWVEDFIATMYMSSTSSGKYWTLTLYFADGASNGSAIASVNSNGDTAATFTRKIAAIDALMGTSTDAIRLVATKTSTPGAFYGGAMLTYRLVG